MNKKTDIEQEPDRGDNSNQTNSCAEQTSPTNVICDPSLQDCIQNRTQDCIDIYEEFKQIGLQLIKKLVISESKQELAAISRLLKKSSECYAPAVEKLRANPLIFRLFNSNQADREVLAKELKCKKDDTIFRVVNIFLSETVPCSQDQVQALRRVLYDKEVVNDTNFDIIKKDLSDAYHSFSLFKEASRHLSVGFLNLKQYFTEEDHCFLMRMLYYQFDQIQAQIQHVHAVIEAFQQIENHLRQTTIAQKNKNTKSAKKQEKALVSSENSQKVEYQNTSIAESKASRAKEAQISKTAAEISKNTIGNNASIFASAFLRVFKSLFSRQQTPTKGQYDDEEQGKNLLQTKEQRKSQ